MTNKSIKLFAVSALAISALGLSAVAMSMPAEAATVTRQTDKVEYVSDAFATYDAAKAFTDSNDMYAGFVGRFSIYPVDTSDASKGYVIVGYVDGFFDEADATQGYANVSALMASADAAAAASRSAVTPTPTPIPPQDKTSQLKVYRLYHAGLQVHLYTTDTNEVTVLQSRGWKYEGISWNSERQQGESVYRLYHPALKVHLYTKDTNEYRVLAGRGWKQEGVAYRSYGTVPVYRMYHTGLKKHLYTKDRNEYSVLAGRGWKQEGIAWYSQP
ncbi:hypothetical protein [Streptococcus suis]|uniref:hypothetical protein n=1 Tax=Streptococcus suis TaxID=1307 RepID=UPI000CF3CA78|nr:hypothetical protein [Streptococcus suis]